MGLQRCKERLSDFWADLNDGLKVDGWLARLGLGVLALLLLVWTVMGFYWSREPALFDIDELIQRKMVEQGRTEQVVGYATTATLLGLGSTLLDKPGGYLRNDIFPPGVVLDNIPNWELGVLIQMRDLSRAMRKDFSRSQSQSAEDEDLAIVEPQFNFDSNSWILPSSESEYRRGLKKLNRYLERLSDPEQPNVQFYTRSDNLAAWLGDVETRLGSFSQRLAASVGDVRDNTDLSGDRAAEQSTEGEKYVVVQTPWAEIDDVFYMARGYSWGLIQVLKAVEQDFDSVLRDKNAQASLRQIIRELEATQEAIWSPVILNGSGFGLLANHSLVMASYISRANAAIIDLRALLQRG